jgi:hypothetical protein
MMAMFSFSLAFTARSSAGAPSVIAPAASHDDRRKSRRDGKRSERLRDDICPLPMIGSSFANDRELQ